MILDFFFSFLILSLGLSTLSLIFSIPFPLWSVSSPWRRSCVSHPWGSVPSSCCSIFTGVSQVSSRTFPLSSPRSREVRRGREGSGWDFVQRGAWPVGARSRGKVRWDLTLRFRDLIPQIPPHPSSFPPPISGHSSHVPETQEYGH